MITLGINKRISHMKTKYFLGAALCVCAAFSSCSDDVLEEQNNIPWQEGDGIQFGARAGFENNDKESRTIYTGEFYKVGDTKFEKINWVHNQDSISILCPEATVTGGGDFADYQVTERHPGTPPQQGIQPEAGTTENSNYDYATLVPATQGKALQWGTAETHHFYACYPTFASTTIKDSNNGSNQFGIKMEKTEQGKVLVSGTIPNNQIPLRLDFVKGDEKHPYTGFVARPVMRNAHMVAYGTHDKSNPDPVNLTFKSIVTALEIDLVGTQDLGSTIIGVLIGSEEPNQRLVGNYSCEINENLQTMYPVCSNITVGQTANQIYIPLLFNEQPKYGNNEEITPYDSPVGVRLTTGQHLKFTAFILPTDNVDADTQQEGLKNLKLTLITTNGRTSHAIPVADKNYSAHLKHYIRNVNIPKNFDSKNWMSRLDDKVKLSQLSIPGSGDSYTFTTKSSYYQSQTKEITVQWNMGIRCFEITSDRVNNDDSATDLGSENITGVGGLIFGKKSVKQAVDAIVTELNKNTSEFAMIILNYQPSNPRNAQAYLTQAKNFINSYGSKVVKYDPNMSLQPARNHIMFIVRPTSDGEDMLNSEILASYNGENFIIVNGWGSLQDKWKQRGYPVGDATVDENGNDYDGKNGNSAHDDFENSVEKGLIRYSHQAHSTPEDFVFPLKGTPNYHYDVNSSKLSVWAQEWGRVVPTTGKEKDVHILNFLGSKYVAWKESYKEKLSDAQATFEKAVKDQTGNVLYFNCLTGYFIESQDETTYRPARWENYGSKQGNVISYSEKINKDFYKFMWTKWNERLAGPMGVVMMNRVGDSTLDQQTGVESHPENLYMPSLVISNNFAFPLKTN